jgi:hypothetical protein
MTAQRNHLPFPASPSMAFAQERVAELRAAAEHARAVRSARGPRRTAPWPDLVVAALRDSLGTALPTPRRGAARCKPCPTC